MLQFFSFYILYFICFSYLIFSFVSFPSYISICILFFICKNGLDVSLVFSIFHICRRRDLFVQFGNLTCWNVTRVLIRAWIEFVAAAYKWTTIPMRSTINTYTQQQRNHNCNRSKMYAHLTCFHPATISNNWLNWNNFFMIFSLGLSVCSRCFW